MKTLFDHRSLLLRYIAILSWMPWKQRTGKEPYDKCGHACFMATATVIWLNGLVVTTVFVLYPWLGFSVCMHATLTLTPTLTAFIPCYTTYCFSQFAIRHHTHTQSKFLLAFGFTAFLTGMVRIKHYLCVTC